MSLTTERQFSLLLACASLSSLQFAYKYPDSYLAYALVSLYAIAHLNFLAIYIALEVEKMTKSAFQMYCATIVVLCLVASIPVSFIAFYFYQVSLLFTTHICMALFLTYIRYT